jgi:hypothetical protein
MVALLLAPGYELLPQPNLSKASESGLVRGLPELWSKTAAERALSIAEADRPGWFWPNLFGDR